MIIIQRFFLFGTFLTAGIIFNMDYRENAKFPPYCYQFQANPPTPAHQTTTDVDPNKNRTFYEEYVIMTTATALATKSADTNGSQTPRFLNNSTEIKRFPFDFYPTTPSQNSSASASNSLSTNTPYLFSNKALLGSSTDSLFAE